MQCPVCLQEGAQRLGQRADRDQDALRCPRCGQFFFDPLAIDPSTFDWERRRHLVTAGLRKASDEGRHLEVTATTAETIATSVREPGDIGEGIDRLLVLLSSRAKRYMDHVSVQSDTDYPLLVA